MKDPTKNVMKIPGTNAVVAHKRDTPHILLLAGGVPVKSVEHISNAPVGILDQACVLVGVNKIDKHLNAG